MIITAPPISDEDPDHTLTPWVLIVVADEAGARSARCAWEDAGFAVEVVSTVTEALACLAVMTPALVVVNDTL
ncbi:MAG: hypothetical protein E6J20_04980 [Chloroflexi bacterium]|nr:MAG: hypothetical protein E6J20_04980 [Chloroflexota bacterium]